MLYKLAAIVLCVIAYAVISKVLSTVIRRFGREHDSAEYRVRYVEKTAQIALFTVAVIVICVVLGIGYGQVHLFMSSVFAVLGIALFAQWSILSNITASLIIFFSFPYRIGDRIKIMEGAEPIIGTIDQISLFHVIIKEDSGDLITYPNNVILQKPVTKTRSRNKTINDLNDG